MSRLFIYAVILNVALLGVFILLDVMTWNNVAVGLASTVQAIQQKNGALANGAIWSNYPLPQVGISVGYIPQGKEFAYLVDTVNAVNLALIWFIVTIVANLSLIWYSEKQRASKQRKSESGQTYHA